MQSLVQSPVQLFRRIVARIRAWKARRRAASPLATSVFPHIPMVATLIHREVTANGVRVYSVCGECGSQLQASATLCEECAQKRSRPARPY